MEDMIVPRSSIKTSWKLSIYNIIVSLWVLSFVFLLFSGPLYFIQYKLFNKIIVPMGIVKVTLIILSYIWTMLALAGKKIYVIEKKIMTVTIVYILYSIIALLIQSSFDFPLRETFSNYIYMMGWSIISFLFFLKPNLSFGNFRINRLENTFYIIAIPLFLIGIVQAVTNKPIVFNNLSWEYSHKILDDYTVIFGYFLGGQIRAFSLFQSPLVFGIFGVFVNILALSSIKINKSTNFKIFIVLLSFICICITLTRNVILYYLVSIIFLYFYTKFKKGILLIYPYLVAGSLMLLSSLFNNLQNIKLLDSSTLIERQNTWNEIVKELSTVDTLLFGVGLVQSDSSSTVVIDNLFFALILYHGVIGLLLFLLQYHFIWISLLKRNENMNSILSLTSLVMCSSFLVFSLFNNTIGTIYIYYFPFILIVLIQYGNKAKFI